jgi:hypothetical protein
MIFKDLGLSNKTLWADVNACAETPEEAGLFASQRSLFDVNNSGAETVFPIHTPDNATSMVTLTSLFRQLGNQLLSLPTREDFIVLRNECDWKWRKNGYCVISRCNGESIFLPAAGWVDPKGGERFNKIYARFTAGLIGPSEMQRHCYAAHRNFRQAYGIQGRYLTRTCDTKWAPLGWTGGAYALHFSQAGISVKPANRGSFLSVRLVAKKM